MAEAQRRSAKRAVPTADINGFEMRYLEEGRGEPVVFVHGGFASFARTVLDPEWHEWTDWERAFAASFRFITYDRRGCHPSSCPTGGYAIENQARDLAGLLDHLQVESAHVLGSSAGGPIALAFATANLVRTRSLLLVGTGFDLFRPGAHDAEDVAVLEEQIRLLEERGAEASFTRRPRGTEVWFEPLWMTSEAKERGELEEFRERERVLAERAAEAPIQARIRHHVAELRNIQAYIDFDGREFASRIEAPTLVLHGEVDRAVPLEGGVELAEAIPGAQLSVIKGASHGLLWRSQEARERASDFIRRPRQAVS
jgi:pimeloyl-ACP methyl ester carboxylesterase